MGASPLGAAGLPSRRGRRRGRWCGLCLPACLALLTLRRGARLLVNAGPVRGVAPEGLAAYADAPGGAPGGAGFRCHRGGGGAALLPAEVVNDGFCDCADGSDEPGTGACAGQDETLFYCINEGSTPKFIYASRVEDGICDCCDGSDEQGPAGRRPGAASCGNGCPEEGERDRAERAGRMERLRLGLARKEEIAAAALEDRARWRAEVARLEGERPALEAALAEARRAEEAQAPARTAAAASAAAAEGAGGAAPPAGAWREGLEAEVADLRTVVEKQQESIRRLTAQVRAISGKLGLTDKEEEAREEGAPGEGRPEPAVSEYAKWMDGAETTLASAGGAGGGGAGGGGGEGPATPAAPAAPVAEDEEGYLEDEGGDMDDDHYEKDGEGEVGAEPPPAAGSSSSAAAAGGAAAAAEKQVKRNKDTARRVQKSLEYVTEDRLGFGSLDGKCHSKHDGQYEYKACFFETAYQDTVLLGSWKGWAGTKEAHFTDGQPCPGGPARMLRLLFECGSEEQMLDIYEPSRCVYEARMTHPGACDATDAAALERPQVRHPRDEF